MTYFSPKFGDARTEALYALSMDEPVSGTSEAPCGWFTRTTVTPAESPADLRHFIHGQGFPDVLLHVEMSELVGFWIVSGDDQGFVYAVAFDTEAERDRAFDEMEAEWVAWDNEEGEQ